MNGIRKAIYTYRTSTESGVDVIVNKAFAERRFMLDVFMTPKPLPCTLPTVPLSQLALHTGHRPGSRMWIGVHGSVYDVTDFCPMHPGGTLIIKSNAGVDCSKSFDNLAHTNNPEVSSLLTKYFVGHLTPKPDCGSDNISALHYLWSAYLRTTVEPLVAHQFEMYEIMGASLETSSSHDPAGSNNIWLRESLPNIIAVRTFYSYQSRLLQGGFAALFAPKLQELVLKLSFGVASANGPAADTKLPDVLGTVARAKTSSDAAMCTKEVALVGQFVCDADATLRFQERGVFAYAARSVELDVAFLEDLRQEACNGMDAFDSIAASMKEFQDPDVENTRLAALSTFLLQVLERIARHLEVFYAQLARSSVYQPQIEKNPARTRWALVRRRIRDGSLFVLATKAELSGDLVQQTTYYMSRANPNQNIDFDRVMAQVQTNLRTGSQDVSHLQAQQQRPTTLNAVHQARGRSTGAVSAIASRENANAVRAMMGFVEKNGRAIRRLSKMPTGMNFEDIQRAALELAQGRSMSPPELTGDVLSEYNLKGAKTGRALPTPPSSRGSSRSPTRFGPLGAHMGGRPSAEQLLSKLNRPRGASLTRAGASSLAPYPVIGHASPPVDPQTALSTMMSRLNTRPRSGSATMAPSQNNLTQSGGLARTRSLMSVDSNGGRDGRGHRVPRGSTSSLRTLKLRSVMESEERVAPTF